MKKRTIWLYTIVFVFAFCTIWSQEAPPHGAFIKKDDNQKEINSVEILTNFSDNLAKERELDREIQNLFVKISEAKDKIKPEYSLKKAYLKKEISNLNQQLHEQIEKADNLRRENFKTGKMIVDNFDQINNDINQLNDEKQLDSEQYQKCRQILDRTKKFCKMPPPDFKGGKDGFPRGGFGRPPWENDKNLEETENFKTDKGELKIDMIKRRIELLEEKNDHISRRLQMNVREINELNELLKNKRENKKK